MNALAKPLVHLNGSGRENLMEGYRESAVAIDAAIRKLNDHFPHMRDYYPYSDAEQAYRVAHNQQVARIEALEKVKAELVQLWESVA